VRLEAPSSAWLEAFLAAASRSRSLHHPWVHPPRTPEQFESWIRSQDGSVNVSYLAVAEESLLVGVVNVSQMVRGLFRSAYLGYYAFAPHQGRGYMTEALGLVVSRAFREHGMHRLEANIQPGNVASIALVRRLGFRREGYSERYLKIGGRWRDHERWAITKEEWPPRRQRR